MPSRRGAANAPAPLRASGALLLVALLLAGLAVRLYHLNAPLVDHHAWKQADLAGIARNYAQGGMHLLHPQIDWGGDTPGYAEMEFPLVPYLAAVLHRTFGEREAWGRLLNILAGLTLATVLFAYVRMRLGNAAAFGALCFALFSPLAWFYGRTFMQEQAAWALALTALWRLDAGLVSERAPAPKPLGFLILGVGGCMALALMCKLNTALVALPMLGIVAERRGMKAVGTVRFWVVVAVALLPPLLWYLHAHALYQETGLTFGILGTGHDKFQTGTYLLRFGWWKEMTLRVVRMLATPPGLLLAIFGVFGLLGDPKARPFLWWGVGAAAFTLIVAEGSMDMEYYQLALVVPAAVACGLGVRALWGPEVFWVRAGAVALLVALAAMGVRRGMAMAAPVYGRQHAAGQALAKHARPGDLVVNLGAYSRHKGGDDYEPNIFYYSRTKGWVLREQDYRRSRVDSLRARGARFVVTSRVRELSAHPDFLDALNMRYRVLEATPEYRVWALAPGTARRGGGKKP